MISLRWPPTRQTTGASRPILIIACIGCATLFMGMASTADKCCVSCTDPQGQKECCLLCSDVASPREHDLLMASMEGLSHYIMENFRTSYDFLQNRAWAGNSHIGNRPIQATFYYDWIRSIQRLDTVKRVCEIGMNGGHSSIIFLAALHTSQNDPKVNLTMFDLSEFTYSKAVEKYINVLYPGMFTLHVGSSIDTVPRWTEENAKSEMYCDVFSVDGDHTHDGALIDIKNAIKATRKGGYLILDDMNQGGPTRQAFDEVVSEGLLHQVRCVESLNIRVGYENRFDETHARELEVAWCVAKVV